jgi:hypothetical protein
MTLHLKKTAVALSAVGLVLILTPGRGFCTSTGIIIESVNSYNSCHPGADLFGRIADAEGFLSGMTPSGSPWWTFADYQNADVWDKDFVDTDLYSLGDDNVSFDAPGLAFSMFAGHGNCEDATSQSCTTSSQCTNPGTGQSLPGVCLAGPNRAAATCVYNTPRHLYTCGSNDIYSDHRVDYSTGPVALGEDANSGAWRGAGTNGGTNFAIFDISCAVRPAQEVNEVWNLFGGLHNLATLMPTNGHSDAVDSTERGSLFAGFWHANPNSSVAQSWVSVINSVPSTEGSTCDNQGGFHGFSGCGANIVISVAKDQRGANWENHNQTWTGTNGVSNDANDPVAAGYMQWTYICNYDCSTYPPVL